ncbi:hypothetical protein LTR95_019041 [Oleoguttula sp. CCFEE 5521]
MEAVEAGSEAVCLKVDEIEKGGKERVALQAKAMQESEKAIVKRMKTIENVVRNMDGKIQGVDKRIEIVEGIAQNADDTIREVTSVLARHGEQIETVTERVNVVETGSEGVQEAITRIKAEQRELTALIEEQGRLQRLAIVSPMVRASESANAGGALERTLANEAQFPRPEPVKKARKATEKTRAAARELANLLEDTPLAASSTGEKLRATRKAPGWIEVERTPSLHDAPPAHIGSTQQPVERVVGQRPGRPAKAGTKRKAAELETEIEVVTQPGTDTQPAFTQRQTRSQAARKTAAAPLAPTEVATKTQQPLAKKTATKKAATGGRKGKAATSTTKPVAGVSQVDSLILPPDAIASSPPPARQPQIQSQSQKLPSSPLSLPPDPPSSPSPPQRQKPTALVESEVKQGRGRPKKAEKPASRREIVQSDDWEEFERQCEGI